MSSQGPLFQVGDRVRTDRGFGDEQVGTVVHWSRAWALLTVRWDQGGKESFHERTCLLKKVGETYGR